VPREPTPGRQARGAARPEQASPVAAASNTTSSALVIAVVSAALRNTLESSLITRSVSAAIGEVLVSALPPDRIDTGATERNRLNLFLYKVTPKLTMRSLNGAATSEPASQLLALDLHYLLSAYGEQDLYAEVLIGEAMHIFLNMPTLSRDDLLKALAAEPDRQPAVALPPITAALAAARLPDAMQRVEIGLEFMNSEESSRLWSATQTKYRLSVAYKVSAAFLEASP
jgi:hypothetical protein